MLTFHFLISLLLKLVNDVNLTLSYIEKNHVIILRFKHISNINTHPKPTTCFKLLTYSW